MAKSKKADKDLLVRIRKRYPQMVEPEDENRRNAMLDLKFALKPGEQWDERQRKDRGNSRPCYEFNKIRVTGKRIINQIRENRPQGKVRAVEDGDKPSAEALEGIARNIWQVSDGDTIIDYAAEYVVFAGMGAWRVEVDYATDDSFDQDVRVKPIANPFCLYADPAASDVLKRDAMDWMLVSRVPKLEYERRWPNAKASNFDATEFDDDEEWESDGRVRICEYWYKELVNRRILQLSDSRVVREDELTEEDQQALMSGAIQILKEREVKAYDIYMCIASGEAILEGPTKFVGTKFPFVMVPGEWAVIDGKPFWCGITRHAKDAQRSYNAASTAITETIMSAPQVKYLVTPAQITGLEASWSQAHKQNMPFLVYNHDPKQPGPPVRAGGADVPVALIQQAQMASEEIKAVTGVFDASLGNRSNETTGIAIRQRQAQGEIATYNYGDNISKGIALTWEIIVDIVQKIYDTPRMVRVLGVDGAEQYLGINGGDPNAKQARDITKGKYDIAITSGPGFSTQREAAAETYTQLVQAHPEMMPIVGDLVFKAMDLPYSDKMAERMKAMLPPQIQQLESQGKEIPPEAQAVMMQAQQALQMAEQQSQLVQQAAAEVQTDQQAAEKAKSEVAVAAANLKVQEAMLQKQVAEFKTLVAETQAQMVAERQAEVEGDAEKTKAERDTLSKAVPEAIEMLQAQANAVMEASAQVLEQVQAVNQAQAQQISTPKPRIVGIKKQGPGMMVPIYDDQAQANQ